MLHCHLKDYLENGVACKVRIAIWVQFIYAILTFVPSNRKKTQRRKRCGMISNAASSTSAYIKHFIVCKTSRTWLWEPLTEVRLRKGPYGNCSRVEKVIKCVVMAHRWLAQSCYFTLRNINEINIRTSGIAILSTCSMSGHLIHFLPLYWRLTLVFASLFSQSCKEKTGFEFVWQTKNKTDTRIRLVVTVDE